MQVSSGLGCAGKYDSWVPEVAVKFFENMMVQEDVKCGVLKPNEQAGLHWNAMISFLALNVSCEFGLVAKMEHYGFMTKMPFEADATFLGDLMGACRLHGAIELGNGVERWNHTVSLRKAMLDAGIQKIKEDTFFVKMNSKPGSKVCLARLGGAIELGNEVAQLLLESQQNHFGRYVQLSRIYIGAERWERTMLDAGIHKVPAHSFS
ncbi:hypothetical protein MTR67_000452 [Solanum verrucosum]|uniref:Pentatricopeptide repeat-containing protein n=1 Tax=Solanum verrucosum TaxID=315347 RepID=A0AAF0PMH7_SOLVR|nr:hypothetical protein MTR67_000452 [Solanum verrucosum]